MNDESQETPFEKLLSSPVRNGIYKKKEFHGYGVKMVNMGELFGNPRLGAISMKRVHLTDSEQERFSVQKGDLLFARRSLVAEGAGKCCVVLETDEPTTFESSIIRARPDPSRADSLFLYYYFNSPAGLHSLDTIRRQVAVAGITGGDLSQLPIRMPPLREQKAIAHVLNTLDDKIELNRRMNRTLEEMARAIFQDWFVDFGPTRAKIEGQEPYLPPELWDLFPDELVASELGETPEGWEVKPLNHLVTLNPKETLKKGTEAPYLDMASLPTDGCNPTAPSTRRFNSGSRFRNGDTLLARITPCLENGKTAYIQCLPEEAVGWGSTEFIVMRGILPTTSEYTYLLARNQDFRSHAIQSMTGTSGRQRVQTESISRYSLSVPPVHVQEAFNKQVRPLFKKIELNRNEADQLTVQRDTLIPMLVSGNTSEAIAKIRKTAC